VIPLQLGFYIIFAGPAYEPRTVTGLHVTDQQPTTSPGPAPPGPHRGPTGAPPLGVPSKSRVSRRAYTIRTGKAWLVALKRRVRVAIWHSTPHAARCPMRANLPCGAGSHRYTQPNPDCALILNPMARQHLGCIPPPFSPAKKADHQAPGGRVLAQRKQRREPSPSADVARVSPVPMHMWHGCCRAETSRGDSRDREPSSGADVAGVSPVPAQMWPG
jgi:hypothetical protein